MSVLIVIRGPLGCGKTTIAKRLADILKAKVFHIDDVLEKHGLLNEKENGYVAQRSFLKANEIINPKAIEQLEKGTPVIIEGNFYWKSQVKDLIERLKYKNYVFTLKAPVKVCIERDIARGETHGADAAKAVHAKVTEFDYGIVVDASKGIDAIVKEILRHIK